MRPSTTGFIGARLREARQVRSFSAVGLADIAGVSAQSIYHYESGRTTPGPEVFERIVRALNLPPAYFTDDREPIATGTVFYRSMASATKGARARAEHRLGWLVRITDWVSKFVQIPTPDVPDLGLPRDPQQISDHEIEEAAAAVRSHWGMDDGPVADMSLLLEHHGFVIARDRLGAESLDGLSASAGRPFVLIGTDKGTAVRWRFDLAHELGHLVLHRGVGADLLRKGPEYKEIEGQAHRFASAFLLPLGPFADEVFGASLDAFKAIKPRWKVSIATMVHRAHDIGMIGEADARRLWINLGRRRWRTSEPLDDVLEPERPRLLRRSVEMIMEAGELTAADMLAELGLPAGDVERLAGLEDGYLGDVAPVRFLAAGGRKASSETETGGGQVLPFVRPG